MDRVFDNFLRGHLAGDLGGDGTGAFTDASFESLPVVEAPDDLVIVFDPLGDAPEGVIATAHADSSNEVTIGEREALSNSGPAVDWPEGTAWIASPVTAEDIAALAAGSDSGGALPLLHVRDEKASGTSGGDFNSGAWRTRTLNTVKTNEITGASLGSNAVTLPAGTYEIEARAPALAVREHTARLHNTTDGAEVLVGSSEFTMTTDTVTTSSVVRGRFTLPDTKTLELQHRCNTSKASNGFGNATSFGVEVYAEVLIRKVE